MLCHEDMSMSEGLHVKRPASLHRSHSTPDLLDNAAEDHNESAATGPLQLKEFCFKNITLPFEGQSRVNKPSTTDDEKGLMRPRPRSAAAPGEVYPVPRAGQRNPVLREIAAPNMQVPRLAAASKAAQQQQSVVQQTRRKNLADAPRNWIGFRSSPDVRSALRQELKPIAGLSYEKMKPASALQADSRAGHSRHWSISRSLSTISLRSRRSRSPSPPARHQRVDGVSPAVTGATNRSRSYSTNYILNITPDSLSTSLLLSASTPALSSAGPKKRDAAAKKMSKAGSFFLRRSQTAARSSSIDLDDNRNDISSGSSIVSLAQTTVDSRSSQPSSDGDTYATDDTCASITSDTPPKDPLRSIFSQLDSDMLKFRDSKTPTTAVTVARLWLLPVLKQYASSPSSLNIAPSDLEFRANVLHKWWNALLDVLDGAVGPVAGSDRSQLYDMIPLIMMRAEWRYQARSSRTAPDRANENNTHTRKRSFTNGSDGGSSVEEDLVFSGANFSQKSALHTVRALFTSTLLRQMVIVVGKMSQKFTSPSLVNFCGKTCAYAFIFTPGVADILVRVWDLSSDLLRRVSDELQATKHKAFGLGTFTDMFPPSLRSLCWTSVRDMAATLKRPATLTGLVATVKWHGPWIEKWRGRETDLFYIFFKYYHLLIAELVPEGLPLAEVSRCPAFVLVHAQMLNMLDSTIHRQATYDAMMAPPLPSLEESNHGADASAAAMVPFGINNLFKGMSENRMIMLLRDLLADHSATNHSARQTFSQAFMALLKAATKRTSQFNQNACFTLCDLLEEVLSAYSSLSVHELDTTAMIDWSFWIEVCSRIMDSQNTLSEIRLLSFIFSAWDVIAASPGVKEKVCTEWLLTEDVFVRFFSHWSPMVRAYYMRLICWRICRSSSDRVSEVDARIFTLVATRLKLVWSYYLWLKQKAEAENKYPPSSAPCYPAPGKKFMIIRTEMQPTLHGGAQSQALFDAPSTITDSGGVLILSSPIGEAAMFDANTSEKTAQAPKKRWSLLSKVLTLSNTSTSEGDTSATVRPPGSPRNGSEPMAKPATESVTVAKPAPPIVSSASGSNTSGDSSNYVFRFVLSWCPPNTIPPRERCLQVPRLPAPAQACVNARQVANASRESFPRPPMMRTATSVNVNNLGSESQSTDCLVHMPARRNYASPSDSSSSLPGTRPSLAHTRAASFDHARAGHCSERLPPVNLDNISRKPPTQDRMSRAKYSGKALAEWSIVVLECNGFVDRRRDEGIQRLADVEIPLLGVELFRKMA